MLTGMRLPRRRRARAGLTVLEVTISLAVLATLLLGAAGALVAAIRSATSARDTSRAGTYLATIMEDLAALPYADLPALDGSALHDGPTLAGSAFLADLTVFPAAVDLLQLRAVVRDARTGREITRVVTLRSNR